MAIQANYSRSGKRGGVVRREPVENVHPLVRRHPVTGEEALYVNRQFTRRIVGLKKEESGKSSFCFRRFLSSVKPFEDTILNLLYDHIEKSADSQIRLKWEPGTVVVWDNRITTHVRGLHPIG